MSTPSHLLRSAVFSAAIVAGALCGRPAPAQSAEGLAGFEAGKDYRVLTPAQPTSTGGDGVEVAEVFMFGCPGCYGLEPHLEEWLPAKPDYVRFVRIPAIWNAIAELHARAYYAAEALGKNDEITGPFFDEFHRQGNHLDTLDKLAAFFGRFGVDDKTFRETFYSAAVDAKLTRARDLAKRYGVSSTPTVVVNGKYVTTGTMAGTYARWFEIIESLAAAEHSSGASKP